MKLKTGKRINPDHFNRLYGDGYEVSIKHTEYNEKYYIYIRENCRNGDWTYYQRDIASTKFPEMICDPVFGSLNEYEDVYVFSDPKDAVIFKMMI